MYYCKDHSQTCCSCTVVTTKDLVCFHLTQCMYYVYCKMNTRQQCSVFNYVHCRTQRQKTRNKKLFNYIKRKKRTYFSVRSCWVAGAICNNNCFSRTWGDWRKCSSISKSRYWSLVSLTTALWDAPTYFMQSPDWRFAVASVSEIICRIL